MKKIIEEINGYSIYQWTTKKVDIYYGNKWIKSFHGWQTDPVQRAVIWCKAQDK